VAGVLAELHRVARDVGTLMCERLVRDLGGTACDHFKVAPEPLKATAVARQFGEPVTVLSELREVMAARGAGGRKDAGARVGG